ncbi:hypothetical protein TSTA_065920 [Talaromyces stipitatus ATCC 10500]|uniref:Reverse transcriptase Ty1/copia-type domain-containing protein n=1 Tax=Talaromyces stipitatus (strain ATCC 10500 / CBS 375.48 / QM 6759 / NRRL 1006) TaxID=441959 RepID=B8LV89_TALSN|nr:uncharacterized protein TSTA_065920 [Talaromyces stipitatus ATCC 10500]EED23139.1 hypothetical protein TSTA_065920 [Talaromyces stipitatus ATCC 10500]
MGMVVKIQNITQAYTQAKTKLERLIIANLPIEMQDKYPPDSLLLVEGPLYGIPKAHHLNKLNMETSMYDPCLLISKLGDDEFRLVGMQTDDILLICTEKFSRAVAAQLQEKDRSDSDYEVLNKRLIWQAQNPERGLRYVPLNLAKARIMVFTDGSFANNRDLTSQIGFLITMVNEDFSQQGRFVATGNILHWQSAKCKRVTQSVLASEVYGLTAGFDHAFTIASTAKMITSCLDLPAMPVIICMDSFSLYECLDKLGTTKEKHLMIDIMALCQSYEKHEIHEIHWIHGDDNPADAFTKSSPNKALRDLVDSNKLTVRVEGFVERTGSD